MALITTISAIIGIAAKGGWFTKAEWDEEILGDWDDGRGGIVDQLEQVTGQTYPYLYDMWDEVKEAKLKFNHAAPWDKARRAKKYQNKVQELAQAVQAEAQAYQQTLGGIPGLENILANLVKSPFVIVGLVFFFVIGIILFTMGKRKR